MDRWRPIATAPTWEPADNDFMVVEQPEIIVGWAGSNHVAFAFWRPFKRKAGGYWKTIGDSLMSGQPTHWMPKPDPPAHNLQTRKHKWFGCSWLTISFAEPAQKRWFGQNMRRMTWKSSHALVNEAMRKTVVAKGASLFR